MPQNRIITMMYDDVANDTRNPNPGVLINEPNGTNVYADVAKDYTGDNVNLSNLYKIINGDKAGMLGIGTGRVIEPNNQNRVFIYFTGTGGKGGFSRIIRDTIWADSFSKKLIDLKKEKKMKEALVFWESSHSGAMFEYNLPYNSAVFAMTSTASSEDSFGWYCNVNNMPVCLAGHFSINWILDAKKKSSPKQTIFEHYNAVRAGVNSSHPNIYGSYKLGLKKMKYFFDSGSSGMANDESQETSSSEIAQSVVEHGFSQRLEQAEIGVGIAEKNIPVAILEAQIKNAESPEEKTQMEEELATLQKNREFMEKTMDAILEHTLKRSETEVHESSFAEHRRCFKKLAIRFQNICFSNDNYFIDHILSKLFAICKAGAEAEGVKAMSTICTARHRSLSHVV